MVLDLIKDHGKTEHQKWEDVKKEVNHVPKVVIKRNSLIFERR